MEDKQLDVLINTLGVLRNLTNGLIRAQGRLDALAQLEPRPEVEGVVGDHLHYQHDTLSLISMLGLGLSALADGDPERCVMVAQQIEQMGE